METEFFVTPRNSKKQQKRPATPKKMVKQKRAKKEVKWSDKVPDRQSVRQLIF